VNGNGAMLSARFRLVRGRFELDATFGCADRGVTGLFGPSGSGKTTLLRCVAGLESGSDGFLRVGDDVWQDSEHHVFVPPHERAIGYVFQEADLFSHLDVRGNLRFALKRAREQRIAWDDAVEWLGVGPLLGRSPAKLSGGERQRVAIARALLSSPRLLLMDEPVSALDEVNRREILPYLQALPGRLSIPILYVSHSIAEVTRLADHMVWLVDGRVKAAGPPTDVIGDIDFARWRRDDAGVVVDATVCEHDDEGHLTLLDGPWGCVWVRRQSREPGQRMRLQISASDVSLGLAPEPDSTIMNQFLVRVTDIATSGAGEVLVRLESTAAPGPALLARITWRSQQRLGIQVGRDVYARVKSVALLE
jgi:molybdate transport system ATP-binding protein